MLEALVFVLVAISLIVISGVVLIGYTLWRDKRREEDAAKAKSGSGGGGGPIEPA